MLINYNVTMKKIGLLLLSILSMVSCSFNEYKIQTKTGYYFGAFKDDEYFPCYFDVDGNIVKKMEMKSAFECSIVSYYYYKTNDKNKMLDNLKNIEQKAIRLSVCFDANQLYVDKDNNLVHNLAYLNHFYNKEENVTLEKETYDLLKIAVDITTYTKGYFNFFIGDLSNIWDSFIKNKNGIPDADKIDRLLSNVPSYEEIKDIIVFNDENQSVQINKKTEMNMNFNALAKGRFLDLLNDDVMDEKLLVNAGSSSISSFGDTIYNNWNISIRNPNYSDDSSEQDNYLKLARQGAFSLSVSGDYQNYYIYEGKRYHHIIDPTTGYPSFNHRSSVVIGDNATYADALSTILMMLDNDKGEELLETIKQETGYSFNFITIDEKDNKIIYNVQEEIDYASLKKQENALISYF